MEIIRCWEEEGMTIPEPYKRHLKVFLAPDKRSVSEITFSHAIIYPKSKTDYHKHDRPELIMVLSGRGVSICDGIETPLEPDMALWVKAGEMHQIVNYGEEAMKLATVFIPAYTAEELLGGIMEAAKRDSKN
jgi:mannose-6-phosphate isomerase-like protein (cupin superfamily)